MTATAVMITMDEIWCERTEYAFDGLLSLQSLYDTTRSTSIV